MSPKWTRMMGFPGRSRRRITRGIMSRSRTLWTISPRSRLRLRLFMGKFLMVSRQMQIKTTSSRKGYMIHYRPGSTATGALSTRLKRGVMAKLLQPFRFPGLSSDSDLVCDGMMIIHFILGSSILCV
ncbi:hypothetical protein EMPG_15271 [Blastomyces silverae]|uniref:Uncharacterized protein n=1 Tax=Blastomyces silverae TaxID=2060906 RepID=A0A0H1BJK1_9EURO|nr:hypothetical protein EMPG_15271 [Blastomyces silverae]